MKIIAIALCAGIGSYFGGVLGALIGAGLAGGVITWIDNRQSPEDKVRALRKSLGYDTITNQSEQSNAPKSRSESMGVLNRLFGYPDIDPTGESRELFEKVGKQTMTMFFQGNAKAAFEHIQQLQGMVAKKYGPYHADVGRANLLGAVMMTAGGQYEHALQTCEAALETFSANESVASFDIEAAEFLQEGLQKLIEHPTEGEGYLISAETPVGKWLWGLKS